MADANEVKLVRRGRRHQQVPDLGHQGQLRGPAPGVQPLDGHRRQVPGVHLQAPLGQEQGIAPQAAGQIQGASGGWQQVGVQFQNRRRFRWRSVPVAGVPFGLQIR